MKKYVYCIISFSFLIIAGTGVFYMGYLNKSDTNIYDASIPVTVVSDNLSENNSSLKKEMKTSDQVAPTPEILYGSATSKVTSSAIGTVTSTVSSNVTSTVNGSVTSSVTSSVSSKVTSSATGNLTNNENKSGETDKSIVEKHSLVELVKLDNSFVIDIKYATTDNFTGKKIYSMPVCLIHKNVAKKLINANNEFKALGYRIKVFDAYRPYSAQQVLWDAAQDKSYVANPKNGSVHNRGAAVDITLVDKDGNEIPMPSGYDEFSERSHLNYNDCAQELIDNRELLGKIMVKNGFKRISKEWWHFDDAAAKKYPILDLPLEEFVQEN